MRNQDGSIRQWSIAKGIAVSLLIALGFAGALGYIAWDNRASVVAAENAHLAVKAHMEARR